MPKYGQYNLESSSIDLLRDLFETHQVHGREPIFAFTTLGSGGVVFKPSAPTPSGPYTDADIDDLAGNGLISVRPSSQGTLRISVTGIGMDFVRNDLLDAVNALDSVQTHVQRYVDSADFRTDHPEAAQELRRAFDILWADDAAEQLTAIGHHAREAMQIFASDIAALSGDANLAGLDAQKTVEKVRGALRLRRDELGEAVSALLDALLVYWGTVSDLAQRQEHGGAKEGEPLREEDGRRLTFHTAIVFYELHRAFQGAP